MATRLYPVRAGIQAGDTLQFAVQTTARRYRLTFTHYGRAGAVQQSDWLRDEIVRIPTTSRWSSGVYLVSVETEPPEQPVRASADGADARSARALFAVLPPEPRAPLLAILPLFTYHAYNVAAVDGTLGADEGACLYSGAPWVSLHRPGGGSGGHPWDEVNKDEYDRSSPRQTFAHWDAKGLSWLEREGFAYDCCTDVELHDGSVRLDRYAAILSFGHHEYWTRQMRERIDEYVGRGGNAAFFGGNTCWFEAEYDEERHAVRRVGRWLAYPEWKTTGVSYAYGGGKWIGHRPPSGYEVREPSHWLFAGLGVRAGDRFGFEERLLGYECDGAPPESDLLLAAEGSIAHWPVADGSGEVSPSARASMGVREAGGMVFTASTVDWARVLAQGNPVVAGITRNVLRRFTLG